MALASEKDFLHYITSKKNQRSQQLCWSGKLTEDYEENRDEFQKNSVSLLAPVRKGQVTSFPHSTLDCFGPWVDFDIRIADFLLK